MTDDMRRKTILLMDVSNNAAKQVCLQFLELGYDVCCSVKSFDFADAIHDFVFERLRDKSIIGDRLSFIENGGTDLAIYTNGQSGVDVVVGLSQSTQIG